MVDKKIKEKVVKGVTFQVWSITGKIVSIEKYLVKFDFDIDNEEQLNLIANILKTFYKYLNDNKYLKDSDATVMTHSDRVKVKMMNSVIDFIKYCIGE